MTNTPINTPDLKAALTDVYFLLACGLILVVSIPLVLPGLNSEFWINDYPFYFDAPLLVLTIAVLYLAKRDSSDKQARDFWSLLGLAFVFWLAVRLVDPFLPKHSSSTALIIDLLYLAYYLCIILALQSRPHQVFQDASAVLIRQLESTSATLFVFGLLVYFILVPATYHPDSMLTRIPSGMLYMVLNLYLFLRVLALRNYWPHFPWHWCYNLLLAAMGSFVLLDGFDLASRMNNQLGDALEGSLFEALWLVPLLGFILAARLFSRNPAAASGTDPIDSADRLIWAWRGKLTYFALAPALIHIVLEAFNWGDDLTRVSREVVVLLWICCAAVIGIFYDRRILQQQQALEDHHQQVNQQLEVAQRMDAIGRLAGGLAHDFNNLLMVISGFADMLIEDLKGDKQQGNAKQISKAVRRAGHLTRSLLTLGIREKSDLKLFSPNDVLHTMQPTLQSLVTAKVNLVFELEPTGYLKGDPGAFEDAILNLVLNALEASKTGGTITIRSGILLDAADRFFASSLKPGQYGFVSIEDDGEGMNEETRNHVFEPFFSQRKGGTGLGLSMVYTFAREAGGSVQVDSTLGRGTKFCIALVQGLGDGSVEVAKADVPEITEQPRLTKTSGCILLVEDEKSVRLVLARSLQAANLTVLVASDGVEALALFKSEMSRIDVVVTDVIMPNMDGGTLAEHIRELDNNQPIIFMTGFAAGQLDRLGTLLQNTPILRKPFEVTELLEEIDRCRHSIQSSR